MSPARPRRIRVDGDTRPQLPRHAQLRFDETRQTWVLLVPERVLAPDDIAVEILKLCDGARRVDAIVDQLATKYTTERATIATDVIALLQDLADKGFVVAARDESQ